MKCRRREGRDGRGEGGGGGGVWGAERRRGEVEGACKPVSYQ
jgi:hypothetical protein